MRKEIKTEMEARIASVEKNQSDNSNFAQAEIQRIKVEAQEENDKIEAEKAGEATWNIYQSYIKAGFTEEQAWDLVQIVMSNATKRTLF